MLPVCVVMELVVAAKGHKNAGGEAVRVEHLVPCVRPHLTTHNGCINFTLATNAHLLVPVTHAL